GWTEQPPPPPAASTRPRIPGNGVGKGKPSCRGCRASLGTSSAVTVGSLTLAGPASTWASCSASSAPGSTGAWASTAPRSDPSPWTPGSQSCS
ncbi:hypothetical protein HGM15179_020041, partial [Zosterops borbonicus]